MKHLLAFVFLLVPFFCPKAAAVGEWTFYTSCQDVNSSLPVGNNLYALCDGNLFVYDLQTGEVRYLSKLTGLSDKGILYMAYSRPQNCLLLVYENGNIDVLYTDDTVLNMPQLKNNYGDNLVLNGLTICGSEACISTGEGIVSIDLARKEIRGYYRLGMNVYDAVCFDGDFFAAGEAALYRCALSDNPLDASRWTAYRTARVRRFLPFSTGLYYAAEYTGPADADAAGLWWMTAGDETGLRSFVRLTSETYTFFYADTNTALMGNSYKCVLYPASAPVTATHEWAQHNEWENLSFTPGGTFWAACGFDGLQSYIWNGAELVASGEQLGGYGPRRDLCYYMKYEGTRLLIAGGRLDPYDLEHYPGTIMTYENGAWSAFQEDGIADVTGARYRNITSVAQDPDDPAHHYATAAGTGLYEFRNGQFVNYWNNHNSPLYSASGGSNQLFVRTDGLNFDQEGNLWMVNNAADTIIRILKADGTWKGIYVEDISNAPTCEKTLFDSKGRFWLCSRRTVSNHNGGLLCLDYNGTVDETADDVYLYRHTMYNQDGTRCEFGGVYALAEDREGALWLGTENGLFVVSDPDEWFSSDFRITQVKVPRNDGTNYADYLLDGVAVSALAVDGGNRKWIGTMGSGVYLVSPDGTEVLDNLTASNSPLISDNIYSLAINPETGELMIGTDKGLVSYAANVTEPENSLQKSNIKVFPNPLRPEHTTGITVTGLTDGADVKVMNAAGQAVGGGRSTGGSFIWDARDAAGDRLPTGVYYILVATSEGKKGVVGKVTIIR